MFSNSANTTTPSVVIQKKYPAPQHPSIEELKKKYEAQVAANKPASQLLKKKSKVMQMASMFNSKITKIVKRDLENSSLDKGPAAEAKPQPKLMKLKPSSMDNKLNSEAKLQPKAMKPKPLPMPKLRHNKAKAPIPSPQAKNQPKSMYFVSENNFAKLTVKDKAQLYTQFITDMSKKNPEFGKHCELMEANVKKVVARGEVVNERQESVKHLLEELEARCSFPKQTLSPLGLQRFNSSKNGPKKTTNSRGVVKSKEFEDIPEKKVSHITTLNITLQAPTELKKQRRARSLPRRHIDREQGLKEISIIEPSQKRSNGEMRSALPIEAYAPPKKIRRTRDEKLSPQIFFQNQQLETLFFTWLKERQDNEQEQMLENSIKATEVVESKSCVDKLLEETIAKLETVEIKQEQAKETVSQEKKVLKPMDYTPKLTPHKKKPAPPVPAKANATQSLASDIPSTSSVKLSEAEESESALSSLCQISREDTLDTPAKESDNSELNADVNTPIKPLRKKKLRRTLTWKKDTSIEETQTISTTDSDSDCKISETKTKNKQLFMQNPEEEEVSTTEELASNFEDLDNKIREVNSPRKIKSAYTLTVFSPTPEHEAENAQNDLETSEWPLMLDSQMDEGLNLTNNVQTTDVSQRTMEAKSMTDSFIDQGFETGSNDMDSPIRAPRKSALKRQDFKVNGPLFLKLASENPSGFSTPIKGHLSSTETTCSSPSSPQPFSPITMPLKNRRRSVYDTESRRNSLVMQVIREGQPLEHHEMTSPHNAQSSEQVFFANAPTLKIKNGVANHNTEKTSEFWIKSGDFSVSLEIYHNDAERVRLLYEIFSQRSCETKDLHFGIDDQTFSVHNSGDLENITKKLPNNKDCSHYWFSTGDLALPFSGKILSAQKVQRLFQFIKSSVEETGILRFGVDSVEFSNVPEFWNQSPKFSMESNYSMLVGLQSGNSNGLEGRSKFAWPNSKPVRISDLDQSDYECEDYEDNDSCRLSFSPFGSNHFDLASLGSEELSMPRNSEAIMNSESFGFDYENESLDQLFEDKYNDKDTAESSVIPEMLNTLKNSQERLSVVQEKISSYQHPSNLSSDALDALKGTPEYLSKLKAIVTEISNMGTNCGFKDCTVKELESYMYFLSHYADLCLDSCSDHMEMVLEALMDQRAVVV